MQILYDTCMHEFYCTVVHVLVVGSNSIPGGGSLLAFRLPTRVPYLRTVQFCLVLARVWRVRLVRDVFDAAPTQRGGHSLCHHAGSQATDAITR